MLLFEPEKIDRDRFWLYAILLMGISFIWPGDIPFINDEPKLIANALEANRNFRLAEQGLSGSVGIRYGPIPTWFFQLCLLLTKDLILISMIKNTLTIFFTLFILDRVRFQLGLWRSPILLIFVSPYLYLLNRVLWDDCFVIPLSASLFLLYVHFLKHERVISLYLAAAVSLVLLFTQLKSLFPILAFLIVLPLFHHRWLMERWKSLVPLCAVIGGALLPYSLEVYQNLQFSDRLAVSAWESLLGCLTGVRYFSFFGWPEAYIPAIYSKHFLLPFWATASLIAITSVSIVFFYLGIFSAARSVYIKRRDRQSFDVRDKLAIYCVATLLVNFTFYLITKHRQHPQYFIGVWFAYFFFLWSYLDKLHQEKRCLIAYKTYFISMTILLCSLILFIHMNGGNRSIHYGATLRNQIDVVQRIVEWSPESKIIINVDNYKYFPHSFYTLLSLYSLDSESVRSEKEVRYLLVDYDHDYPAPSGHLALYIADSPSGHFLKQGL